MPRPCKVGALMFVIKASTPEAMRNEIVKWLNQQASNHRIAAAKIQTIRKTEIELARATTYEGAARFLENCTVENTSVRYVEVFAADDSWKFTDAQFVSPAYDTLLEATAQGKAYADSKNLEFKY